MKILAFDTSTRGISLAVADNQTILRRRNPKSQFLSSSIMPAIQSILKSCGLTLKSMDGIIIGLGPGSFTSLRVGIATAQALTFAHKIPAVGLSSLDTIAMNVKVDGTICVMNDARRGLVYACVYEKRNSSLKRLTDYSLDTPEALVENLDSSMMVIGDAVPLYRTLLLQRGLTLMEDPKMFFPDARHLVTLGFEQLQSCRDTARCAPTHNLAPIYLYPDNCQVHK